MSVNDFEELELDDEIIEENGYDSKYKFRKFFKTVVPTWILVSTLSIMATGINVKDKIEERVENNIVQETVADVEVSREEVLPVTKKVEIEVPRYDLNEIKFNDEIDLPSGLRFYESSDHDFGGKNNINRIGDNLLPETKYTIEGISIIIPDNESYKVCPVIWDKNSSIEEAVDKYLKENNINRENCNVRLHFSDPVSGWINYTDLVKYKDKVVMDESTETKETITSQAHKEDFDGKVIFKENGEDITIKLTDENDDLLKKGDMVIGSNGKIYSIDSLLVMDINRVEEITNEYVADKLLCWSVKDISLPASMIIMGTAFLGAAANIKKRKDEENDLFDDSIDNVINKQEQIKQLLKLKQEELLELKNEYPTQKLGTLK